MPPPHRPSQTSFIVPMYELNYTSKDNPGFCYGMAYMGMQAILANDLYRFNCRRVDIDAIPDNQAAAKLSKVKNYCLNEIHKIKQQYHNYQLTDTDRQVLEANPNVAKKISLLKQTMIALLNEGKLSAQTLDSEFTRRKEMLLYNAFLQDKIDQAYVYVEDTMEIPAFFEGMALYQTMDSYKELFEGQKIYNQNGFASAPLVLSKKLEEQGGIRKIDDFSGIYSRSELFRYFESLQSVFLSAQPLLKEPIALILVNGGHAITIGFNPSGFDPMQNKWVIVDANCLSTYEIYSIQDLVNCIFYSFNQESNIAFSTEIYANPTQEHVISNCIENWKKLNEWQKIHNPATKASLIDDKGYPWLLIAARQGQTDTVKQLLANNAAPNLGFNNNANFPLLAATYAQSISVMQELLNNHADPDAIVMGGGSCLIDAMYANNEEMLTLLLSHKANPNLKDNLGQTALHFAADYKNAKATHLLLEAYADPNLTTNSGYTPLYMAANRNSLPCVNLLLAANANPNLVDDAKHISPLLIAVSHGNYEIVKALLAKGANPNLCVTSGASPLMVAAEHGYVDIMVSLLHAGALTDIQMADGLTALHFAACNGHYDAVRILLSQSANPNLVTNKNISPLFYATKNNYSAIIQLLCLKGANPLIPSLQPLLEMRKFAAENHAEIAMEQWLNNHRPDNKGLYNISPREVGEILGNNAVAYYLRRKEIQFANISTQASVLAPRFFQPNFTPRKTKRDETSALLESPLAKKLRL